MEVFLVLVLAVCSVGWSVHSVDADTVGCLEYFGSSESVNLQISAPLIQPPALCLAELIHTGPGHHDLWTVVWVI